MVFLSQTKSRCKDNGPGDEPNYSINPEIGNFELCRASEKLVPIGFALIFVIFCLLTFSLLYMKFSYLNKA